MQECLAPRSVLLSVHSQLQQQAAQSQPFLQLIHDYAVSLQHNRELQVRGSQLDKEAAELRDEVRALNERLRIVDEAKAIEWRNQALAAQTQVKSLTAELDVASRERDLLREQLTRSADENRELQQRFDVVSSELEQVTSDAADLREALAQTSAALEHEREARIAAASEVQGALEARETALSEAERLRADNLALSRRLVDLKEREIERMNEINTMHEEMLAQASAMRREADAEREAAQLIRNKAGMMAAATLQAAAAAVGLAPHQTSAGGGTPATTAHTNQQPQQHPVQVPSGGPSGGWPQLKPSFTAPTVLGRMFGRQTSTASQPLASPATSGEGRQGRPMSSSGQPPSSHASQDVNNPSPSDIARGGSGILTESSAPNGTWDLVGDVPSTVIDEAAAAGLKPVGLAELMGLPPTTGATDADRSLPKAPYRSVIAHRGGCCSLAIQSPGHLMASCGVDKQVAMWDLTVMRSNAGAHHHLHGMSGGVNSVCFTADGSGVLGAGADKSIHLWDVSSGGNRHTLTGHSGSVVGVHASPLDVRIAVSIGEDRAMKIWDLVKGFTAHSVACNKMPNALALSSDGNTIATGHIDGSICLWDVRQCWAGSSQPLAESKVCTGLVVSLAPTASDSLLLVGGRDGNILLWDFRVQATVQHLKAARFTPGTQGSSGRGRCHMSASPDGRWVAAGGADGGLYVWDLKHPSSTMASTSPMAGISKPIGTSKPPHLTVLSHHKDAVVAAAWSVDSAVLASADKAGVVAFWSLSGYGNDEM